MHFECATSCQYAVKLWHSIECFLLYERCDTYAYPTTAFSDAVKVQTFQGLKVMAAFKGFKPSNLCSIFY